MSQRIRYGPEVLSSVAIVGPEKPSDTRADVNVEIAGFRADVYPAVVTFRCDPHTEETHVPLEIVQFVALPADVARPENPQDAILAPDAVVHVAPTIDRAGGPVVVELTSLVPGMAVRIYSVLFDTVSD
jgi:hypothetical protein